MNTTTSRPLPPTRPVPHGAWIFHIAPDGTVLRITRRTASGSVCQDATREAA